MLIVLITFGGRDIPWNSPVIPILIVIMLLAILVLMRHERQFPLPILPFNLINNREMVIQVCYNFFGAMAIFGVSAFTQFPYG